MLELDSVTVSAARVYGVPDPQSMKQVRELWSTRPDADLVCHNGPGRYCSRRELERQGVREVHFRFKDLTEVLILKQDADGWWRDHNKRVVAQVTKPVRFMTLVFGDAMTVRRGAD